MEIVYIETTIVSYLVARPSTDLVLSAHQEVTREWWDKIRSQYRCVSSQEVMREASLGDSGLSKMRLDALAETVVLPISTEAEQMADLFLSTHALPATMRSDAVHLAIATVVRADYLLTWNCRHLANATILRRLEGTARKFGWKLPTVCTPMELMGEFGCENEPFA